MKRRYRYRLVVGLPPTVKASYDLVWNAPLDGPDDPFNPLQRTLVRPMMRPASFVDRCERRGVATDILRQNLLETIASMRKSARIDHRAGHRVSWYARLIKRVQAQLRQLPSPRRVPRARRQNDIGLQSAPDCWENYAEEEFRFLQARDRELRRPSTIRRTFDWIDPLTNLLYPIEGPPRRRECPHQQVA